MVKSWVHVLNFFCRKKNCWICSKKARLDGDQSFEPPTNIGEKANISFGCYPRSVETWRLRVATLCPLRNVGLNNDKWRVLFVAPTRKNPWETTPLPNPSHIPSHPYPSRNLATSGRRSRCGHLPKPKFSPTEKRWFFGFLEGFSRTPAAAGVTTSAKSTWKLMVRILWVWPLPSNPGK